MTERVIQGLATGAAIDAAALDMLQLSGLRAVEEPQHRVEQCPRRGEVLVHLGRGCCAHRRPRRVASRVTSAARPASAAAVSSASAAR